MPTLNLKATHKPVREYYAALEQFQQLGVTHEGAVKTAFSELLRRACQQFKWALVEEYTPPSSKSVRMRFDGVIFDQYKLRHGVWEAKDSDDDLAKEVKKKFKRGYPKDNILFQEPERAILVQNGRVVFDESITHPEKLVEVVRLFLEFQPPEYDQWDQAAVEFKDKIPDMGREWIRLMAEERTRNPEFVAEFDRFTALCRQTINPNLSEKAIEKMLIQHLLTVRIFRTVFNNPEFVKRNSIASEIERVIDALTSRHFSRAHFMQGLDRFYGALEGTAATIKEFSAKQEFLNQIYEDFFQGFDQKKANTHGIVYTPQTIVDFMVKSADQILKSEFDETLADKGVNILDPFVGTGNFIVRIMQEIPTTQLKAKYNSGLHCNEVMLLPYYIAAMNIEHAYFERMGEYEQFNGIVLVDTFELAEPRQLSLFGEENTARAKQQKKLPITLIIGNPPYNAWQINANDNNKNRKYEGLDSRIYETYHASSTARNKSALSDTYVKAIRWASDRLDGKGVIAFVTNRSFIDAISFDGMRQHLADEFDSMYILDLQGNIRRDSMRDGIPLGEKHTVFGLSAMVGIAITFFVKGGKSSGIQYHSVDFRATREDKFALLEQAETVDGIEWTQITPDQHHFWLNSDVGKQFQQYIPIASREGKARKTEKVLFASFSNGVATNRDAWLYNFNQEAVARNMQKFADTYHSEQLRWEMRRDRTVRIDDFVTYDDTKIKWSARLKERLMWGQKEPFNDAQIRSSAYRPFCAQHLYYSRVFAHRAGLVDTYLPTPATQDENRLICITHRSQTTMDVLATNLIPSQDYLGKSIQALPFYVYDEDGTNRRENITDWALAQFHTQYDDKNITKWDIFHYVYAILHHPEYRKTYAINLRREFPRMPFVSDFWAFATAGQKLTDLHINYEQQPAYALEWIENRDEPLDWCVERMRLNKEKTAIQVNDFLTISGIPAESFKYKIGTRSVLHWLISQYQIKTDKRSHILSDPNRLYDQQYIVNLVGQVVTISLETIRIIHDLPALPSAREMTCQEQKSCAEA